jgi:hypothetical protein
MECDNDRSIAWENWRFQVDSGWNRSNYFAVVETVALAGAWQVLDQNRYPKTALFFAFLGLLSTIIWFLNDLINHTYILYWWRSVNAPEGYEKKAKDLGIGRWWPKVGLKYSQLMHIIPIIFGAAWIWMLGLFIPPPRYCYILAMVAGLAFTWTLLAILKKKVSDSAEQAYRLGRIGTGGRHASP